MNKLIVSWFVIYAVCAILTGIYQGSGGLTSSSLTQTLSAGETNTIYVTSTTGFKSADTIWIENEQIDYTAKTATTFTGLTRARNRTSSATHVSGSRVFSYEMGVMNQSSGAAIAQTDASGGTVSGVGFNLNFLLSALPNVVLWNYPFLSGQLIYLKIILQMVGIGLTVSLIIAGVNAFTSVFR